MSIPRRNARNSYATTLTCGLMTEAAWGASVLVLAGSRDAAVAEAFGRSATIATVACGMSFLGIALILVTRTRRRSRRSQLFSVIIFFTGMAAMGSLAIASLMTYPGLGLLLTFGWILTFPVGLAVQRSQPRKSKPNE